jgi:NADPH:quinone reductase-like Zn-dependent oxidoreductase
MKAVVLKVYGDADQFEYVDVADPKPAAGEVLVKVIATSLNPIDWKIRAGYMKAVMPLQFPTILGYDVAGEVVGLGSGVTRFKKGDKVMGIVEHSYAEFLTAKADDLALVPDGMELDEVAVIPLVATTGTQLIEKGIKPKAGDTILITGALGPVGRTAVYVAGLHGALVIAGVRKSQKGEAQLIGAERVVAIDDDVELANLGEIDAIADAVGGATLEKLLPKLKKGGVLATLLGPQPAAEKAGVTAVEVYAKPDAKRLSELADDVKEGDLVLPIAMRFKLSEMREAHTAAQKGVNGKVLITP